jgi:hypothetical protein
MRKACEAIGHTNLLAQTEASGRSGSEGGEGGEGGEGSSGVTVKVNGNRSSVNFRVVLTEYTKGGNIKGGSSNASEGGEGVVVEVDWGTTKLSNGSNGASNLPLLLKLGAPLVAALREAVRELKGCSH